MDYSIYIHFPFCRRRCHYCDFNTYAGFEDRIPNYVKALEKEFRIGKYQQQKLPIHSLYFGGGTPSLIQIHHYEEIVESIHKHFNLLTTAEISIEANPGTLDTTYLLGLKRLGVNRISIGVQSTNPFDLRRLDRIHTNKEILESYHSARMAGFDNINLDLIFGLPGQDLSSWRNTLIRAISLDPEHFSLYSLIIEPGTPLYHWHQRGLIEPQNQDLEADMYALAMSELNAAGYHHYEISNWAKSRHKKILACRHNLQYWLNQPYFGFGAGAHGYVNHIRTENIAGIEGYIDAMIDPIPQRIKFPESPATMNTQYIDRLTQMKDTMLLGLRLIQQGVREERFFEIYGESMRDVFHTEIQDLISKGLVEWVKINSHQHLRLSKRGVMIANQVFMAFVG